MSDNPKSDVMHTQWRTSIERFDYFVLGSTGALCAFVSQTFVPERLAFSPATIELLSLLILIASGMFGFLRLETANGIWGANFRQLFLTEESHKMNEAAKKAAKDDEVIYVAVGVAGMSPQQAQAIAKQHKESAKEVSQKAAELADRAFLYYRLRNYLLLAGIVTLLAARIWKPYFVPLCQLPA